MTLRTAEFLLRVPLQPKERPRFTRAGHAYTDSGYREWTRGCRAILAEWWTIPPLGKGQIVSVHFTFRGPGLSDLDNLQGAVMDAGKGIVWTDDRVTVIQRTEANWVKSPRDQQSINLTVVYDDSALATIR